MESVRIDCRIFKQSLKDELFSNLISNKENLQADAARTLVEL